MQSHVLDATIDLGRAGKLAPYAIRLDYDADARAVLSTTTWGARWDDTLSPGKSWSVPLHAEAALQRDTADNPADVDAEYWRLEATARRKVMAFGVGLEMLGGAPDDGAFQTPLATLHKFNGWADLFLTTPPDGLFDVYASFSGKREALAWTLVFHDFESDAGATSYGSEIDLELVWTAPWKQALGLAWAGYDADDFATDTSKLWVFSSYRFGAKLGS
jgi:hypothetical protein